MEYIIALKDKVLYGSATPFEKGLVAFIVIVCGAALVWYLFGRNKTM